MQLTIRDAVPRLPVGIAPEAPLALAEQRFIVGGLSEIYVIDGDRRLLGVLPDYEVLKHRQIGGRGDIPVRELMAPVTFCLPPDALLETAARHLRQHLHSSLPVVEAGRLVGQLCRSDVLRTWADLQRPLAPHQFPASDATPGDGTPATFPVPTPRFLAARKDRETLPNRTT